MDTLVTDFRFALRSLRRRPTFAVVALTSIALSIGAATSMFSVVDAVLFRALPYRDPGKLVAVWQTYPEWKKQPILAARADRVPLDYGEFIVWRQHQTAFSSIGLWAGRPILLAGETEPELVQGARISPSLFETLGVKPILGRGLLPGEDVIGGPRVTVISYEAWQSRFGGRADVIGRTVAIDRVLWTIVGVLPRGFTLERGKPGASFWVPAGQDKSDVTDGNHSFRAVARLKPGVTMEQALVETTRLLQGNAPPSKRGVRIAEYHGDETKAVRRPLLLLLGAAGVLLLVSCVNIATLLLGEGTARVHEMGTRIALGASRGRLVRQLLTESVVLSAVGGAMGAILAWWATRGLVALAPDRVPGVQTAHVDLRVLGVSLLAAATTGILFGLLPALATTAGGVAAGLRSSHQSMAGRAVLQRTLIAAELALSVVLLVGAALLARSLDKLTSVDPGFRAERLLVVRLSLPRSSFDSAGRLSFYQQGMTRLAALPGVEGATAAGNGIPFTGNYSSSGYSREGDAEGPQHWRTAVQSQIAANYFSVLGIPLLAGRAFTGEDRAGAPLVVIVSEAAARRDWPNESAIGKRVKYQNEWRTIVGVVADSRYETLSKDIEPTIFTPQAQRASNAWFVVRTRGEPTAMISAVRQTLRELSPAMVFSGIDVMDDLVRRSMGEERFRTLLLSLFGIIAAVLAAVGMYGVTSRAVSRRTREVGIRVALGATASSVIRLIVGHTLSGVAIGVVIGTAIALATARVLTPYLFSVSVYDPVAYASIFGLLALVSMLASWVPARRAGRVQPATVLRE